MSLVNIENTRGQKNISPKLKERRTYDNFVGVDLHVHTPKSSCYKGKKNGGEYINILKRYIEKGIKVIAITDHNTISGYEEFLVNRKKLTDELSVLKKYSEKHPSILKEIDLLNTEMEGIGNILVLPGVELELKPGIHMLVIFDPNTSINDIKDYIKSVGYTIEEQGQEKVNIETKCDVLEALEMANALGAITIAAHIDSNKGIYNDLKGTYRASVFRSSYLTAVSYNNPSTMYKIKSLMNNEEYKRRKPLAYIQCSDYHGGEEIGNSITFMQLDSLDFQSVINAIQNPLSKISATQHPENKNLIDAIIKDPSTISFINVSKEDKIARGICAVLNSGYGNIVIGAEKDNYIGVLKTEKECQCLTECLMAKIDANSIFSSEIKLIHYGNGFILVLNLNGYSNYIYSIDGKVYILKDREIVLATPKHIMEVGKERVDRRHFDFVVKTSTRINAITKELKVATTLIDYIKFVSDVLENSILLPDIVDLNLLENVTQPDNYILNYNGTSSGDLFIVNDSEPHLSYAYLRCSCPRMKLDKVIDGEGVYKDNQIVIVPGGGCYCIDHEGPCKIINKSQKDLALLLSIKNGFTRTFSFKSVVAWLKSPIFQSFAYIYFGSSNIHQPQIYKVTPIIHSPVMEPGGEIEKIVDCIIGEEKDFLDKFNSYCSKRPVTEPQDSYIDKMLEDHNKHILGYVKWIDGILMHELKLPPEEYLKLITLMDEIDFIGSFINEFLF